MKIIIIGAGIAGLTASHQLTKLGHDVEIYEATERAGGRGRLMNRPGTDDWADVGSQYYVSGYDAILDIIDDVGLTPKLRFVEGKSKMFMSPGNAFVLNPKLPWIGGGSLLDNLRLILYSARLTLFNRIPVYGPAPEHCRLDARSALESTNSDFIKNYFLRMATRTGLLNDLETADVSMLYFYRALKTFVGKTISLEGGTASLHLELARRATVHYNQPVATLIEQDGVIKGVHLENGDAVHADHVFVAAQPSGAAKLVPSDWALEREYLEGVELAPAIIVSLFLTARMNEDMLSYYMPLDGQTDVSFCTDANQKGTGNTPSGKTTLQAWIINPKAAELIEQSDEHIFQIAVESVKEYLPEVIDLIEDFAITRHYYSVPNHRVGHNRRTIKFLDSVERRPGVSFIGDYLFGNSMETAARTAQRAIAQLDASPA